MKFMDCLKIKVHRSKNALSEFIDLSDTNYKSMDQKIHFQRVRTCAFKVYGPK